MLPRSDVLTRVLAVCMFLMTLVLCCGPWLARADAPDCTGNRHMDQCGQYCPDPPTTTTTLPGDPCPDPGPCPSVQCGDGDTTTIMNVTVNRCPDLPQYVYCREYPKFHKGLVFNARTGRYLKCRNKFHPRAVLVPVGPRTQ